MFTSISIWFTCACDAMTYDPFPLIISVKEQNRKEKRREIFIVFLPSTKTTSKNKLQILLMDIHCCVAIIIAAEKAFTKSLVSFHSFSFCWCSSLVLFYFRMNSTDRNERNENAYTASSNHAITLTLSGTCTNVLLEFFIK